MRRWLACNLLVAFVLACLPGCGEKDAGKKADQFPNIPQAKQKKQ